MEAGQSPSDLSPEARDAATLIVRSGSVTDLFSLGDNLSNRSGCRAFAARRLETGEEVRLTFLTEPETPSPRPEEELAQIAGHTAAITAAAGRPESLLPVQAVIQTDNALCCTEPLPAGVRLADYLRRRVATKRSVSFAEGISIFYPIAQALDFLLRNGQEAVYLGVDDLWISGSGLIATAGGMDLEPLNEKSDLEVRFSAICVAPESDPSIDPNATASGSIGTVTSPDELHPACGFGRLIYRVLAGRDVPRSVVLSPRIYETTTLLESKGNNLLRDLLSRQRPWIPPGEILRELCAYQAVAWPPKKSAAPQKREPKRPPIKLPGLPVEKMSSPGSSASRPAPPPPLPPPTIPGSTGQTKSKPIAFILMGAVALMILAGAGALAWRIVPPFLFPPKIAINDGKTTPPPDPHPSFPDAGSTPNFPHPTKSPWEDRTPTSTPAPRSKPSKEHPWVNTLGLEFVPIPTTHILMSRTLTRVQDFRRYSKARNYHQRGGLEVLRLGPDDSGFRWEQDPTATFETPGFSQSEDCPVVGVNWLEAKSFCNWLSSTEGHEYRLPTDAEWSAAIGTDRYAWGEQWPPPPGSGNFAGLESIPSMPINWGVVAGYNDGFPRTSPVKQFHDNIYGIFDMAGNARQWCEDPYRATMNDPDVREQARDLRFERNTDGVYFQILRGSSWADRSTLSLRASLRRNVAANVRSAMDGFRCVVADTPDLTVAADRP